MKTFSIKLKHDTGTFTLYVKAVNKEDAINIVMKSENCPESAIVSAKQYFGYVPNYLIH